MIKFSVLFLSLLISEFIEPINSDCSGGIWPIQDSTIGTFTVSWRYNIVSNTVQFIIQGQASASISLTSTYIALGWSDTAPTMSNMDVAMFFVGANVIQDRYSQGHSVPSVDSQQDFCLIRTNTSDKNVYFAFERYPTTGDSNDISFLSILYLMFSMGSYTSTMNNNSVTFNPQYHFFRTASQITSNLLNCVSNSCLTTNCTTVSCPCLQQVSSGSAQCVCFPPSPCVSGSTITPSTAMTTSVLSTSSNSTLLNSTCQCLNGGTCLSNGTCLCSNRYRGKFCQILYPCLDYCYNNGTCSVNCTHSVCNTPVCNCINGYSGSRCETVVGSVCQTNSCVNGNCVMLSNTSYQCQCTSGFIGIRCDLINSCLSSPCNQGTCVVSTNCVGILCGYSCLCPNGTSGTNCQIGANSCLSNPCQNGGICNVVSTNYVCQCLLPYGGSNCELTINVCTPNPCFNDGICTRNSNISTGTYLCQCSNGYTGTRCEYLSSCVSSPCLNNGQCISTTANCSSLNCFVKCLCVNGTTGTYCEQLNTTCPTISCLNGGTCVTNSLTNISYCQCPTNTIGSRCETIQSLCTSGFCSNSGVCYIDASYGNNTLRCLCSQGYTGTYCQSALNTLQICSQNPCGSNGTCIAISNSSYYCMCSNGVNGQSCSSNSFISCSDSPCNYLSTCQNISNSNSTTYRCICPNYLTGDRCQYTNNCQKQPCFNQSSCIPLGPQNNFMCVCQLGFGNYDCSTYLGLTCNSSTCSNGGTCIYNGTTIQCLCPTAFAGARCEWTSVCSANTCLNGGTCRQTASTMVECLCAPGFTGPTCSLRDSCANFPCKHGGACAIQLTETNTQWAVYQCRCPSGYYGQNCETSISSCSTTVCPSYKICNEQATGPVCTCTGTKVGTFCQYNDPCSSTSSNYCLNGGICISTNTDPPIASCLCQQGYTGSNCNSTSQDSPCASNPCQARGYCALSITNTSYSCICNNNYTGTNCERNNPCASSPCLNQAICQSNWNTSNTWYTCTCVGTYTGTRCETSLLNPCGGLCMNGSPCVNGTCVCPAQYTGTYCGFNNPCYNSTICQNSGFCSPNSNSTGVSYTCTCQSLYTGQNCEMSIYALSLVVTSCSSICLNGGSCVNGVCVCTSQYVGPTCQYQSPCVNQNPCLNSGTCFGKYNTNGSLYSQCFCPVGYVGTYCETTLCNATTCNGGLCLATQNTFVCSCPIGKVGDRCQYNDSCSSNPCLSSEQCVQNGSTYQCLGCYDKSTYCTNYQTHSEYCDNRYTILINNTYVSVPDACKLSCNKCSKTLRSAESVVFIENQDYGYTTLIEEDIYTSDSTTTTTMTTTTTVFDQNMIFSRMVQCVDNRDDCSLQKQYGFCDIFNTKYPYDCMKTCHPNCVSNV